jgi:hypothetical protein
VRRSARTWGSTSSEAGLITLNDRAGMQAALQVRGRVQWPAGGSTTATAATASSVEHQTRGSATPWRTDARRPAHTAVTARRAWVCSPGEARRLLRSRTSARTPQSTWPAPPGTVVSRPAGRPATTRPGTSPPGDRRAGAHDSTERRRRRVGAGVPGSRWSIHPVPDDRPNHVASAG